jgi:hypothetical protein
MSNRIYCHFIIVVFSLLFSSQLVAKDWRLEKDKSSDNISYKPNKYLKLRSGEKAWLSLNDYNLLCQSNSENTLTLHYDKKQNIPFKVKKLTCDTDEYGMTCMNSKDDEPLLTCQKWQTQEGEGAQLGTNIQIRSIPTTTPAKPKKKKKGDSKIDW